MEAQDYSVGAKYVPITEPLANEYKEKAWALTDYNSKHSPIWINRQNCGEYDVKIKVLWTGICHSDVHHGRNHLKGAHYPFVAGHEIAGEVIEVGAKVTKVKVGDNAGIGCMSDACLDCDACANGDEQHCQKGKCVPTYNGKKRFNHLGGNPDSLTYGGYSGSHCLHEHFIIKFPDGLPLQAGGPLLCAGITMYEPLKRWGAVAAGQAGKKMTIGIIGIGGLGTMGLKLAKAMGHTVVAISRGPEKKDMAMAKGADAFVVSKDPDSMAANAKTCDLILATLSADHEVSFYMSLLRYNGTIVELGLVTKPHTMSQIPLILHNLSVAGSHIGGMANTQECIDFCAKHKLYPDLEEVTADKIDWVWEQLENNADGKRYVIDIQKSLDNTDFVAK